MEGLFRVDQPGIGGGTLNEGHIIAEEEYQKGNLYNQNTSDA
jgi:hypothetical protein